MFSDSEIPGQIQSRKSESVRREAVNARDYVAVARGSDLVVLRVVGRGNMITAPGLADFADQQRKAGFRRFVLDLERCEGMDSTFVGVLVGLATSLRGESETEAADAPEFFPGNTNQAPAPQPAAAAAASEAAGAGVLTAVNVSANIRDLLTMLGADAFIRLRGSFSLPQLEATVLPEKSLPTDERHRLIQRAHEKLIEIDKRNIERFGKFLQMLSSELGGASAQA